MDNVKQPSLISVGLMSYNQERYIEDTLDALLDQKYRPMELVILDDGSSDATKSIIHHYEKKLDKVFDRIIDISNKENNGNIPQNLNRLIQNSNGEFFLGVSGDDMLLPNGIQILHENLENHPECILAYANMIVVSNDFKRGDKIDAEELLYKERVTSVEPEGLFYRLMGGNNTIASPTAMRRMKVFQIYGYHDETIAYEDYEYWLRISRTEKILFVSEPVLLYRRSSNSLSNYNSKEKLIVAIDSDFSSIRKYENYLTSDQRKISWRQYFLKFIHLCRNFQCEEYLIKKLDGIDGIDFHQFTKERLIEKLSTEILLLEKWIFVKNKKYPLSSYLNERNIHNVAIYGYSRLGKILLKELQRESVKINFIIDQKGKMLDAPIPVYEPGEDFPMTDAVIVAIINSFEDIKSALREKTNLSVLNLKDVIEYCSMEEENPCLL